MGLIGSAIGAAGSIFGGISVSKAMKKIKSNVEAQRQKNQNWYDRRYNEDYTQRADAQRILTQTDESVAATKEANSKALADATSQIAAQADARKDNIEATYMQNDNAFVEQLNQLEKDKAEAITGAVQRVTTAASKMPF